MIEVLVAMFLSTLGLVYALSQQMTGLTNINSTHLRTQASLVATDIANKMRLNPTGALQGDYNTTINSNFTSTANLACLQNVNGCNPEEIADFDLHQWSHNFTNSSGLSDHIPVFPEGKATINVTSAPNPMAEITINWDVKTTQFEGSQNAFEQQYQTQTYYVKFPL